MVQDGEIEMKNLGKKLIAWVLAVAFCLTLWGGERPAYAQNETVDKDWFIAVFFRNKLENGDKAQRLNVYKKNADGSLEQIGTGYNKADNKAIYEAYKALMTSPTANDLECALTCGDRAKTYFDGDKEFASKIESLATDFETTQLVLFRDFSHFSNTFLPDQKKFGPDTDWEKPDSRPKMNLTLYKDVKLKANSDALLPTITPLELGKYGQGDWTLRSAPPRLDLQKTNVNAKKVFQDFLTAGKAGWPYSIKAEYKEKDLSSLISLSNGTKLNIYSVILDGEGKTPLIQVAEGKTEDEIVKEGTTETTKPIEKVNALTLLGNVTLKNGKGDKVSGGIEMGKGLSDTKQNELTTKKDEDTIKELLDVLADLAKNQENQELSSKITEAKNTAVELIQKKDKTFKDNAFEKNQTAGSGGAIHIQEKVKADIQDAKFNENKAGDCGGAIASDSAIAMKKAELTKNTATNNGGALYLPADAESKIDQSSFKENEATNGGALWVKKAAITETAFDSNKAKYWGGAIYKDPFDLKDPKYDDLGTDNKTKFVNNSADPYLYSPEKISGLNASPDSHLTNTSTFTLASIDGKEVNNKNYTPVNNYDISYGYRLVIYRPNGGEGDDVKEKMDPGKDLQLRKSPFTRTGYRFTSWNPQEDGKGKAYKETDKISKSQVNKLVSEKDGSLTLYAQWEKLENVTGKIPSISKTITGDKPENKASFKFRLVADEKQPMPGGAEGKEASLSITGQDEKSFDPIEFPAPKEGEKKVYTYRLSEDDGKLSGYTYDDHVYKIRFTLTTDKNGKAKITREVTLNGNNYSKDTLKFENKFSQSQKTKQEEQKKKEEQKKEAQKIEAKKTQTTITEAKKTADDAKKIAKEAQKKAQQANSAAAEAVKIVKVIQKNCKNCNPSTGDPFPGLRLLKNLIQIHEPY